MKTIKNLLTFGALAFGLIYASMASALIIPPLVVDFRDSSWASAYGQNPFMVENVTAKANQGLLYQDSRDGLGIMGSVCGYEVDEIDTCEKLTVTFDEELYLISDVLITDLFGPSDGVNGVKGEYGKLRYNTYSDNSWIKKIFWGINSEQSNGEQLISLGQDLDIKTIEFWVPKYNLNGDRIYRESDEFSVAGFTGVYIPEPTPLVLLGLAILGFGAIKRKS